MDRRQPRHGPRDARPCRARLVGRDGRPRSADRHRALLRRVPEHARRVPGIDGPVVDRACDGPPLRLAVPRRHHPRHGAGAARALAPPRDRAVAERDRWVHGWHAGARVGRHVPECGAVAAPDRRVRARRRHSRSRSAASVAARSASTRNGEAATTTTPHPATGRTRVSRSRDSSPRSPSARTMCSPTASDARSRTCSRASRCGSASRSSDTSTTTATSSCAASTRTPTW